MILTRSRALELRKLWSRCPGGMETAQPFRWYVTLHMSGQPRLNQGLASLYLTSHDHITSFSTSGFQSTRIVGQKASEGHRSRNKEALARVRTQHSPCSGSTSLRLALLNPALANVRFSQTKPRPSSTQHSSQHSKQLENDNNRRKRFRFGNPIRLNDYYHLVPSV